MLIDKGTKLTQHGLCVWCPMPELTDTHCAQIPPTCNHLWHETILDLWFMACCKDHAMQYVTWYKKFKKSPI